MKRWKAIIVVCLWGKREKIRWFKRN